MSVKRKGFIFKHLSYNRPYKDFNVFYDENKEEIYLSIIELFESFKTTRKKILSLRITAKISDLQWDTEFNFNKEESFVLKRDIMPFFEENEKYEICSKIIKLDKELCN